jgi:SHS2 domain-containing protein
MADIRLSCRAASFPELVRQALLGTIGLLVTPPARSLACSHSAQIEAPDRVGALVQAVNEMLFAFDAEGLVPGEVLVEEIACSEGPGGSGCTLRLCLRGDRAGAGAPYRSLYGVKAATYHRAEVSEQGGVLVAELTLDL